MTDQHPLTDELCEELPGASCITILTAPGDPDPYLCPQYIADDMRAAANWQLEQVIEWWKTFLNRTEMIPPPVVNLIIEDFKQEMRPTTTQENN